MSTEFDVRVVPRSSQQKVELQEDGTVKVWVHAAPADGQANAAICEILASRAGIAPSRVQIVRGETSRTKRVRLDGIELSEALKRLS